MPIYNSAASEDDGDQRTVMIKAFAENIRRIRVRRKLTQEAVAERAGINPKYLGEIERGLKSPTAVVVRRLADAMAVPICSLLATRSCPCDDADRTRDLSALLSGKNEKEVQKAIKLIELFFE